MNKYKYCPRCGSLLEDKHMDGKTRQACSSCDFVFYHNPTPAAGVILIEDQEVLLVKRKYPPKVGMWTLPAGFVEADENARDCAVREMKEETNIDVQLTGLFNIYSAFDDPRASVVLILFLAERVGGRGELRCGDDASDARFFHIDDIPEDIAFKAHRMALKEIKELIKSRH
ncbi:MAG: NUDIX domain-containing protein [Candidatus Latescibacteria bacterium]|nr:NUDIX domain-containing protein [Candidatus Latescibacterota bacterium]NIM22068.1 NUDIX domain-containing protein [Candidatus Latescibacterota bacterium]NIM66087.1 NUDIX domain-containing protein [Candidatus Latescibacterota bacterium]NIO02495.1 NUDIX domain-containing protein [Candidatus Latescibacterota bacterium]NIO29406.1 NUDIX domain-containing protein [Candidatus Latescibacterota bacterium]